jgi:hypothetical protein
MFEYKWQKGAQFALFHPQKKLNYARSLSTGKVKPFLAHSMDGT